jgi:tetratricopeptide repeat protein 30
MMMQP